MAGQCLSPGAGGAGVRAAFLLLLEGGQAHPQPAEQCCRDTPWFAVLCTGGQGVHHLQHQGHGSPTAERQGSQGSQGRQGRQGRQGQQGRALNPCRSAVLRRPLCSKQTSPPASLCTYSSDQRQAGPSHAAAIRDLLLGLAGAMWWGW